MEKGTRFGKEQMEAAWQSAEVDALYRLAEAGVRVPQPRLFSDGVLLMDLILDADGKPDPRLWDVEFSEQEAIDLHLFLVRQAVLILCAGMVHGDLSEYNVLLAWDGPMIIDLPQATDAAGNPNSMELFVRDVENLRNFLARFAPQLAETRYAREIWDLYERALLFPETPLTGRWKGSDRRADTRAVLEEIETAARDAMRKRALDGGGPRSPAARKRAPEGSATERPHAGERGAGSGERPRNGTSTDRSRSAQSGDRSRAPHSEDRPRSSLPADRPRSPNHGDRPRSADPERRDETTRGNRPSPRQADGRRDSGTRSNGPVAQARGAAPPPRPTSEIDYDDIDALLLEEPPARSRR
jgi:RIO kinase 1